MTEFARINQPRIARIEAAISTIQKSGRSNKVSYEDLAAIMEPIAALLRGTTELRSTTESETVTPAKPIPLSQAPHIHRIGAFVDGIPRHLLTSYLTHISNRICE